MNYSIIYKIYYHKSKLMESQIIGAIKIKDALFIGDEFASKVEIIHLNIGPRVHSN